MELKSTEETIADLRAAVAASRAARGACINPDHDHERPLRMPGPLVCPECDAPQHYDSAVEDYRHDNPETPACFLIRDEPNSPCVYAPTQPEPSAYGPAERCPFCYPEPCNCT